MFVAVRAWTGGAALGAMHSGRVTSPPVEAPKTSLGFQLLRSPASTESPAASQFFFQGLAVFLPADSSCRSSGGSDLQSLSDVLPLCNLLQNPV